MEQAYLCYRQYAGFDAVVADSYQDTAHNGVKYTMSFFSSVAT